MKELSSLSPICYSDLDKKISLRCYADTLVYRRVKNERMLVAVRFGGYPEQVRGMCDAMYGGIKFEAQVEKYNIIISTLQKQYRKWITHDGIYAEALMLANDDSAEETNADQEASSAAKRKMFIFSERDNQNALFEEIDKKTAAPLLPEFRDYVLGELEKEKILIPLEVVSASASFDAYMLEVSQDEKEIISIINRGLETKQIHIPKGSDGDFNAETMSQYLKEYGVTLANRIRESFTPLFDPATESICDELKRINGYLAKKVGYTLYPAQLGVAESIKRRLDVAKVGLIIAECGSGKTKIGAAALHAHQKRKSFNIVLCPSHVSKKWVREIEETLPNSKAVVIRSISDVDKVYEDFQQGNKTVFAVMSKERARDGYMKRPAVRYSISKKAFLCPDCGGIIEMSIIDDGCAYKVTANQFFFQKHNDKNHKCEHCQSSLWTAINPGGNSDWIKIGNYGFVHRRLAEAHLKKCKDEGALCQITKIIDQPDGVYPAVGAYRRYSVSGYINEKIKVVDGLILDELHLFKGDSGQGLAMAKLVGCAEKVIGMTATLINGYSSGIFYLLFRIAPYLMLTDGKSYCNPSPFNSEYGVTESVYAIDAAEYNANSRNKKSKERERQLPGVSPLVYSRFLIESAAFLSLNDMGKHLPDYEEIPVKLDMSEKVRGEYDRLERSLTSFIRNNKQFAMKILSRYLGLLSTYPDQPYDAEPIRCPGFEDPIVTPADTSDFDELHEKDIAVLDIVERKVKNGERVLIYTNWVKIDTQEKLAKILTEKGYRVETLKANISPEKREEWVENKVQKGIDVLITNPSLVETGLDLNAFTTLIYYNIGYNLFTFRQSSRRSWRINQTAPRIEVYILYYAGTMQSRAIKLMASKLAVATIIEGNLSDEGLSAMSDCRDMTAQLAKELTLGIRDEVEDVAETFRKMAIVKPDEAEEIIEADYVIMDETIEPVEPVAEPILPKAASGIGKSKAAPAVKSDTKVNVAQKIDYAAAFTRQKRKKSQEQDLNQISMFDLVAS